MNSDVIIQPAREQLRQIIAEEMSNVVAEMRKIAQRAAAEAIEQSGLVSEVLTKQEAYDLYGRQTVDRWIREGYLCAYTDVPRGRARIRRAELHNCAKRFNVGRIK